MGDVIFVMTLTGTIIIQTINCTIQYSLGVHRSCRDGLHNLQVQSSEIQNFQHFFGICVHLNWILLQRGNLRDVVVPSFPLLFLKFDGNTPDRSQFDSLHKMCDTSSNLVAKFLAWDDCNLLADSFVGVEVVCQSSVVFLDDDTSCFLDCLCTDTTHGALRCLICDVILISVTICSLIFFICPH